MIRDAQRPSASLSGRRSARSRASALPTGWAKNPWRLWRDVPFFQECSCCIESGFACWPLCARLRRCVAVGLHVPWPIGACLMSKMSRDKTRCGALQPRTEANCPFGSRCSLDTLKIPEGRGSNPRAATGLVWSARGSLSPWWGSRPSDDVDDDKATPRLRRRRCSI